MMPQRLGKTHSVDKSIWIIAMCCVVLILDDLAQNLLLPALPYYSTHLGLTSLQIGAVLAAESASVLVFSPLLGRWVQSFSRLVRIICVGILLFALSTWLYGFSSSFALLLLGRVIQGIAVACNFPAVFLFVARTFPFSERIDRMSQVNTVTMFGALATPFISGALLGAVGVRWTFAGIALAVLALDWVFLISMRDPPVAQGEVPGRRGGLEKSRLRGLVAAIAVMAEVGFIQVMMPLRLSRELHFTPIEIGSYFFTLGLFFAFSQPWICKRVARDGDQRYLVAGLAGAGALLTLASFLSGWLLAGLIILSAMFLAAVFASALVIMGSDKAVSEAFGLMEAAIAAGLMIGTGTGGLIYNSLGPAAVVMAGVAVAAMSLVYFLFSAKIGAESPTIPAKRPGA